MKKKLLAIGNILLCDDGIAVHLCEALREDIEKMGYEVFSCETDGQYAYNLIEEGDELVILDSAFTGSESGKVIKLSLEDYRERFYRNAEYGHNTTIYDYIFKSNREIKGHTVVIEVCNVELNIGLSELMALKLDEISSKVLECLK